MAELTSDGIGRDLHGYVDAFESAWRQQGGAEPAHYLPPPSDPIYYLVLRELVRVDLEFNWSKGRPKRLEEYQRAFPALFEDPEAVREIALEECRLRRQAGQEPDLDELLRSLGVGSDNRSRTAVKGAEVEGALHSAAGPHTVQVAYAAPSAGIIQRQLLQAWGASLNGNSDAIEALQTFRKTNPFDASRMAQAMGAIPEAGQEFLGFRLLTELGRGAFGRVFLAEQTTLANRLVALKIAADLVTESQTLAQLQHTNIVPIYSIHRAGALHAVCMPFFGATTCGDVVKSLEKSAAIPASGKAIVSTLHQRHSSHEQSLATARRAQAESVRAGTDPTAASSVPPLELPVARCNRRTADLVQLEQLTYVDAILWVGARLAEGLAHAHDRGIVHRDLKPANILLSDEGQPMLLDFNLSEDTKVRGTAVAARMGGTLPYMSPEQLKAFEGKPCEVDSRSDIYSLGVILYELLNGQHPFPRQSGTINSMLPRMVDDRNQPRVTVRRLAGKASPAVVSIIQHCLEVNPADRYQSAHDLAEDLQRHLDNRPLRHARERSLIERGRKWVRRNPRATTSLMVAVGVLALITIPSIWFVISDRAAARNARETRDFETSALPEIQALLNESISDPRDLEEGLRRNAEVLNRYHVIDNPRWKGLTAFTYLPPHEREKLTTDIGELLYLQSRALARRAERDTDATARSERLRESLHISEVGERESPGGAFTKAGWLHRAAVVRQLGNEDEARRFEARAADTAAVTAMDRFQVGVERLGNRQYREGLGILQDVTRESPTLAWAWFCEAVCHQELGQFPEAIACYNTCLALYPESYVFHFNRGIVYRKLGRLILAANDIEEAIRLRPDLPEHYVERGLLHADRQEHKDAVNDFTAALERGADKVRIYFYRAHSFEQLGDLQAADRDRDEGFRATPADAIGWTARGMAKLEKLVRVESEPTEKLTTAVREQKAREIEEKALDVVADFDEALKLDPRYYAALQDKAHVLSEHLHRNQAALEVMDRQVELYPNFVPGIVGRGVIRARLGQRAGAQEDAKAALDQDGSDVTLYMVSNIYSLTSRTETADQRAALRYLSAALRAGFDAEAADRDPDFDAIHDLPEFRQLVDAAKKLRGGAKDKTP